MLDPIQKQDLAEKFADHIIAQLPEPDLHLARDIAERVPAALDSRIAQREHDRLAAAIIERQQAEQLARDRLTLKDPAVQTEVARFSKLAAQNLVLLRSSPSLTPGQKVAVEHLIEVRAKSALAKVGESETGTDAVA